MLLPPQVAENLKKIGFQEESRSYYKKEIHYSLKRIEVRYSKGTDDTLHGARNYNDPKCMDEAWNMDYITAPTICQTLTWLRNHHKLFIFLDRESNETTENVFFYKIQYTPRDLRFYGRGVHFFEKSREKYRTYEEAELEAIKRSLNILKDEVTKA